MKLTSKSRPHLRSAAVAALYALVLHVLYTAAFPVVYLIQGGAFGNMVFVQLGITFIGIIALFVVRRAATERLTFYVALMLSHILLAILFWLLASPVFEPMLEALQAQAGVVLTGRPEENFDGAYLLVSQTLMHLLFGVLFLLAMLLSALRASLRRVIEIVSPKNQPRK